jgi:hypothetical protein
MEYLGFKQAADKIMSGTCNPPEGIDTYITAFINQLSRPENIVPNSCPNMISEKEQVQAFSKVKETTSSSYSNLRYGQCIANPQVHELTSKIDAMIQEIPCKIVYSLKCWRNGIEVEVLKEENIPILTPYE